VSGEEVRGGVRGGAIDAEDGGAIGSKEEAAKWSYRGERELGGDYGERWDSRGRKRIPQEFQLELRLNNAPGARPASSRTRSPLRGGSDAILRTIFRALSKVMLEGLRHREVSGKRVYIVGQVARQIG
jgi:hypothetical protein